jgi:hypothetical protein
MGGPLVLFREFSSLQSIRDFQKIKYPHLGTINCINNFKGGETPPLRSTVYTQVYPERVSSFPGSAWERNPRGSARLV